MFLDKLSRIIRQNNSLVSVGLDSDMRQLPDHLQGSVGAQLKFNLEIVEATHDLVCAYKLNTAFYEAEGAEGITQLKNTCDFIREHYPEITIVLDAKRADIGNTNEGYVTFAFDYLQADAITLHPYLGREAIQPFLDREDKGSIILCRTSNIGAGEFQDLKVDGEPLYRKVARSVCDEWNEKNNCLLVVGATYPEEVKEIREIAGEMTFLVPGVGVQGGDVEKVVRAGRNLQGEGMIVNSSRGIIFASKAVDFAQRARDEARTLKETINTYR